MRVAFGLGGFRYMFRHDGALVLDVGNHGSSAGNPRQCCTRQRRIHFRQTGKFTTERRLNALGIVESTV